MNDIQWQRLIPEPNQSDKERMELLEQDIMLFGFCMTKTTINPDGTVSVVRVPPDQAIR